MGGWPYALAQVIQKLGRFAGIDATMGQGQQNFIVGTLVVLQLSG